MGLKWRDSTICHGCFPFLATFTFYWLNKTSLSSKSCNHARFWSSCSFAMPTQITNITETSFNKFLENFEKIPMNFEIVQTYEWCHKKSQEIKFLEKQRKKPNAN
jgi:hypothetical protein